VRNARKNIPIKPVIFILLGSCLLVAAALDAYRGYHHYRAVEELQKLLVPVQLERPWRVENEEQTRFTIVDSQQFELDSEADRPSANIPNDELPRLALSAGDLLATDRFVRPLPREGGKTGDGSRETPWNNLQFALNQLKPGDRLIVLNGKYPGKYAIGAGAVDGEDAAPISVYFASDATLEGDPPGEPCVAPVLSLGRSNWKLVGLNLKPQACSVGVSVEDKVTGLVIESPHISEGAGFGLVVAPGASEIEVLSGHLHHLGSLEGKDKEARGKGVAPETSPYAAVKAPIGALMMSGGKVHNIFGPLALFVSSDGSLLSAEATESVLAGNGWSVSFVAGQARWW
jgi:hypothetical protein